MTPRFWWRAGFGLFWALVGCAGDASAPHEVDPAVDVISQPPQDVGVGVDANEVGPVGSQVLTEAELAPAGAARMTSPTYELSVVVRGVASTPMSSSTYDLLPWLAP